MLQDSLLAAKPYRILTLEDRFGKTRKIITWKRYAQGKFDNEGNPMIWDNERMWALLDNKSWVVVQFYVFNSLKLYLKISVDLQSFSSIKKRVDKYPTNPGICTTKGVEEPSSIIKVPIWSWVGPPT